MVSCSERLDAMCNCYVQHLDEVTRYSLHNGAHNPKCPWYRRSLDPVDHAHDEEFRAKYEIQPPTTHRII